MRVSARLCISVVHFWCKLVNAPLSKVLLPATPKDLPLPPWGLVPNLLRNTGLTCVCVSTIPRGHEYISCMQL